MLVKSIRRKNQDCFNLLDLRAYDERLIDELKKFDAKLPICENYGVMAAVAPGSSAGREIVPLKDIREQIGTSLLILVFILLCW